MEILIYGLLILGIGLILFAVIGSPEYTSPRIKLPEAHKEAKRLKMRSFLTGIFPTRKFLEKTGLDVKLSTKLAAGHLRLSAQEFFNLKLLLMIVLAGIAYAAWGKVEPGVLAVGLVLGYIIPELILRRVVAKRKYSIARLLPETVDLLGLCVEAGLDFATAVKWIIEKTPMNPMLEELAFVLEEIKWGKPRSQALKDMAHRLNIPEVSSFVQTLVLAERMGTPVAEAFMILSEDTRLQRFHRGERYAMQAPIKILIPLIFCILPVIGIVVGGPILLEFMQGKLFGGG